MVGERLFCLEEMHLVVVVVIVKKAKRTEQHLSREVLRTLKMLTLPPLRGPWGASGRPCKIRHRQFGPSAREISDFRIASQRGVMTCWRVRAARKPKSRQVCARILPTNALQSNVAWSRPHPSHAERRGARCGVWVRRWLARVSKSAALPSTGTASRPLVASRPIPRGARMSAWWTPPGAAHRGCLRRGPSIGWCGTGAALLLVGAASAPATAHLSLVFDYSAASTASGDPPPRHS